MTERKRDEKAAGKDKVEFIQVRYLCSNTVCTDSNSPLANKRNFESVPFLATDVPPATMDWPRMWICND